MILPMINDHYFENYQDFPKNKKKSDKAVKILSFGPSKLTMQFILGYGSALKVMKTKNIGNLMLLMN